jgi:2-octaprenyl-6-methoxyphenol hydroxylase
MNKQKICIIGGSLTGLATAISLSKYNCSIDLIADNISKSKNSSSTIAVSQNNLEYFNKIKLTDKIKNILWPCSMMKLYIGKKDKFSKILEYRNDKKVKKILYMFKSSRIKQLMFNRIKKIKSIKIRNEKKISKIYNNGLLKSIKIKKTFLNYNLIILCTGSNSDLVKDIFKDEFIKNSYSESAITTILKHGKIKNNTARQVFLDDEIFALLPISNTQTSIVWSIKKSKNNNIKVIKEKIKSYAKLFLKNIKFESKIECRSLSFLIRNKYFKDRVLLFGDALHEIHPFVGQGFNMTLRDLSSLEKILQKKINLGLDIGSADILSEFSNETKPGNLAFSLATDMLKNSFAIKNKYFKKVRNTFLGKINDNKLIKNIFLQVADKGFKF